MTEEIMQCCYTNAVQEIGGKISSGWQPVAVSGSIPSEAYNGCVSLQNANATIQAPMVDERGNVLNLYEITGDGSFVYVSRTQYGLLDRLGRPNMFSHAYIFSWKREDVLEDPNTFLTIDRSSFAEDEQAASVQKTQLRRTAALTLPQAMNTAGLTPETYLTLIQCVYCQFSERKTAKPLFIQFDGSDEQLRAILYCIYWGLPHYVRKTLAAASAISNTSDSKNIIFSEFAAKHETYLMPQTGENNLLTQRTERKLARLGFPDFAARNCRSIDARQYFVQLDALAAELGDPTASNELILKLAHQMIEGGKLSDLSDEELDSRLSDALRSKTCGSQRMDDYISDMLDEVRARKMFLTEESEANLAGRLASPATARLADSGEQYNIYRFSTLSVEEAARLLTHLSEDVLARYAQTLAKSDKGLQILDHYYASYALAGENVTWQALSRLLEETGFMARRPKTIDLIDTRAWALYDASVSKQGAAVSAYDALMDLMGRLYGVENQQQYAQAAKETYWERKRFADFSQEDLSEYKAMALSGETCNMFAHMYQLLDIYKDSGEELFFEYLGAFFRKFRSRIEAGKLTEEILCALEKELRAFCGNTEALSRWMKVAAVADDEEALTIILSIRRALQEQDYGTTVSAYLELTERTSLPRSDTSLIKALSTAVCEECTQLDSERKPVPLDVWLLLGAARYANSFELFDHLTPAPRILQADEFFVVQQSRLLARQPYFSQAEDYVQRKGAQAKTIRKWLSECKAAEKKRRAEEKKARAETNTEKSDRADAARRSSRPPVRNDAGSLSQVPSSSPSDSRPERRPPEKRGFLKELFGRK